MIDTKVKPDTAFASFQWFGRVVQIKPCVELSRKWLDGPWNVNP